MERKYHYMHGKVTIAVVYTARTLVVDCSARIAKEIPGAKIVNLVDEGLIGAIIEEGRVSPPLARRFLRLILTAQDAGADLIFETCSSVGDIAEASRFFVAAPIVRIDEAMALEAVRRYSRVTVLSTLSTTLGPTKRLLESRASSEGRMVEVAEGLAEGAFQALQGGDREKHDQMILDAAMALAPRTEAFVLAQASMAAVGSELIAQTGKPVLSSFGSGIALLKSLAEGCSGVMAREDEHPPEGVGRGM